MKCLYKLRYFLAEFSSGAFKIKVPYLSTLAIDYYQTEITVGLVTGASFIDPSHMYKYINRIQLLLVIYLVD